MKRMAKLVLGAALVASAFAANAAIIATVNLGSGPGANPYWDDYNVFFGLGSTSSPTWVQQVAWVRNTSDGFNGRASLDISAQWDLLGGQDWWVLVDDEWSVNSSFLTNFSIDTGLTQYVAPGLPVRIRDLSSAYAYISTPVIQATSVPEPGTLALGSIALLGIGLLRRRDKAAKSS